ncbi:MAG: MBL fold metallo-hydrolase, partial [Thermodesulfobacteriota bacterium]
MIELIFLGTAGGRYVVAKQLRASAGTLLKINNSYLLLDPGPGTLVY